MIAGTVYGVVLNDAYERAQIGEALRAAPYHAPPVAPVVYIKPRNCFRFDGAAVQLSPDVGDVVVSATIGVEFARDCGRGDDPIAAIGAARLALDLSEPEANYYRPAIRQRCRDGFLPLGAAGPWRGEPENLEIETRVNGAVAHRWSLSRLVRPLDALVRDLASFMTLQAGDLLLVGLAGDAPRARRGDVVEARCDGYPSVSVRVESEA